MTMRPQGRGSTLIRLGFCLTRRCRSSGGDAARAYAGVMGSPSSEADDRLQEGRTDIEDAFAGFGMDPDDGVLGDQQALLYALSECLGVGAAGQRSELVYAAQPANRPVCVAISVDLAGERDVLGLWLGPAGGERAEQWATMLTELRNRGPADALIVCRDGNGGPALLDPRRPARSDSPDVRGAHGPKQPALCVHQALGPDHQRQVSDVTRSPSILQRWP